MVDALSVKQRVLDAQQAYREAAEASRQASEAPSLEMAAAVEAGVTGYRLAKWLGVADTAVRKRLRQARNLTIQANAQGADRGD